MLRILRCKTLINTLPASRIPAKISLFAARRSLSTSPPPARSGGADLFPRAGTTAVEETDIPTSDSPAPFANLVAFDDAQARLLSRGMAKTSVSGYGLNEFTVNGIRIFGSVFCFQNFAVCWKPEKWEDVKVDSLRVLELLRPKPDLIIFGSGSTTKQLPADLKQYLSRLKIGYEVMRTWHAAATASMLNEEGRRVVAALVAMTPEDMANRKPY